MFCFSNRSRRDLLTMKGIEYETEQMLFDNPDIFNIMYK